MGEVDSFTINIKPEGTAFQHLVWSVLKELPYGKTMTYGEISKKVAGMLQKSSMSAQAVGGAIGRNPISIIIPCHRVIGNKGQLTGYAGGLDKKRVLLIHEGCQLV